ncbi:MAG: hypothetical protein ACRDGM_11690 [bacterium]
MFAIDERLQRAQERQATQQQDRLKGRTPVERPVERRNDEAEAEDKQKSA